MRALSQASAQRELTPGIDLAPMLDFVVNLLIFFIVTAVFTRESGITVARPTGIAGDETPAKSIVIGDDGGVSIDGKPIDLRAVRANIERFRATDDATGVVVVAHEHAPTGVLVAVVDQTRLGGIDDITFTTGK